MDETGKIQALNPGEMAARIDVLERRNAELEAMLSELRAEVERLKRRQHRQAAPFSRETRVAEPKRPGRKSGQGSFTYRTAPSEAALGEPVIAVPVTEVACPHCGGALAEEEQAGQPRIYRVGLL